MGIFMVICAFVAFETTLFIVRSNQREHAREESRRDRERQKNAELQHNLDELVRLANSPKF